AGEVEVDGGGEPPGLEEDIVREEVCVDDPLGQAGRPGGADLGQGQVALGELGPAAVDQVEDL
ncbi:MAG TPA: hypothetical protein VFD99_12710, partial [Arthrobacter sp.]|nr:hypothetical protein [Arthrobacter sp.]